VLVHTDAVQAFVADDLDAGDLGVDLLSLAAHKFGGPEGVGVLYVRSGVVIEPVSHGGGQELGRRSGTHNVAGAVGTALAMELAAADRPRFRSEVAHARACFEDRLASVAMRTVPVEDSITQHSHLRFPSIRNETLLIRLDQLGVAASVGSACQSGAATVSHVLTAMGMSAEDARHCLRFSFGWTTRPDDGAAAADMVLAVVKA
jgi:cysteine desulfurase